MLNKFFNKLKFVTFALILSCFLLTLTVTPSNAQSGTTDDQLKKAVLNSNPFTAFVNAISNTVQGTSLQKFTSNTLTYIIEGSLLILVGCDPEGKIAVCNKDFKTGAVNTTGTMIGMLYTPQASGVEYVASTLKDFGLVESAYAQTGSGFENLEPLRGVWQSFRNITYMLFVIIFLVIGLAVMFRYRLNPQTVVTVQLALPRIIIALLLVTFSYAIAGFVIDLLYIVISLMAVAFADVGVPGWTYTAQALQQQFTEMGFFAAFRTLFEQVGWGTPVAISAYLAGLVTAVTALFAAPVAPAAGLATLTVGSILLTLILVIIVFWILIRLFLSLLQSYIAILLLVVFGPIYITAGIIPGFGGFGSWLRSLVANLATFAGVAFVLMLGLVLVKASETGGLWQPPVVFGGAVGTAVSAQIRLIIGFGILLIVHQVPNAVRNAFGIRGLGIAPDAGATHAGWWPVRTPLSMLASGAESQATQLERDAGMFAGIYHRIGAGIARGIAGK